MSNDELIIQTGRGPTVTGTRITLYQLMEYLKDGWTPKHVAEWFGLSQEQMDAVMDYLRANEAELEQKYAAVLQHAEEERRYWTERNRERDELPGGPAANSKIAIGRARLAALKRKTA